MFIFHFISLFNSKQAKYSLILSFIYCLFLGNMDSYYHQPSCPLHDFYSSYPSYIDQSSPQIIHSNIYAQPLPTTQTLNTTFELGMKVLVLMNFIIFYFSSTNRSSSSSTYYIFKRTSYYTRSSL